MKRALARDESDFLENQVGRCERSSPEAAAENRGYGFNALAAAAARAPTATKWGRCPAHHKLQHTEEGVWQTRQGAEDC